MEIKISVDGKATLHYRLLAVEGDDREGRIANAAIRKATALSAEESKAVGLEELTNADGEVTGASWRRRCEAAIALTEITLERDHAKRLMVILDKWPGIRQVDHDYFAEALYQELKSSL
jgi:hypothetical protein